MTVLRLCIILLVLLQWGCESAFKITSAEDPAYPAGQGQQPGNRGAHFPLSKNGRIAVARHKKRDLKPTADIWVRIRDGFEFFDEKPENRFSYYLNSYALTNGKYFLPSIERSQPFLHYVLDELEKRNMPSELALLPIIESGYDPYAFSPVGAVGIWQLMPQTARDYGVKQDWWFDGRRDLVTSTTAALDYLERLNIMFNGDWLLTLAAYNSGEGRVSRAIQNNQAKGLPTDYWSLQLPPETRDYVPKLLAVCSMVDDPNRFDVALPEIANKPIVTPVKSDSQLDLAIAAKMAGVSLDELYKLNPGYNRWATSPKGPHTLLLPSEKADEFASNIEQTPLAYRFNSINYHVRSGDTLKKIASANSTTPQVLSDMNDLSRPQVQSGQTLIIPVVSKEFKEYSAKLNLKARHMVSAKSSPTLHIVRPGETLSVVSRKYDLPIKEIVSMNRLSPSTKLHIGQKIKLNITTPFTKNQWQPRPELLHTIGYRVRHGESLRQIAERFKVNLIELAAWNGLKTSAHVKPGQKLIVHVDMSRHSLPG